MKKLISVFVGALAISALAVLPDGQHSFDSMSREGSNIRLNFSFQDFEGSRKVSLLDSDGVATVQTLTYLLTQQHSSNLYIHKEKWPDVKDQPVEHWGSVKDLFVQQLARAEETYVRLAKKDDRYKPGLEELRAVRKQLAALGDRTPNYDQLNPLSTWLRQWARKHRYEVKETYEGMTSIHQKVPLVENTSANPIGESFLNNSILPPRQLYGFRTVFEVDLPRVMAGFKSSSVPNLSPGPLPRAGGQFGYGKK